ncbi:MAG: hypothetical protein F6K22_25355 [Okeania sp. SIO2F4]|uniref:hypothetical protein n=1 Tax=Okeania sp. SIO2F4 TaxID=2607790 RepID=UPI001428E39D|nr:hypothetical protein [Okeania sp. SIO2F4]NES05844.1 hypothetical protein [Okeania sp. SIO2F4]
MENTETINLSLLFNALLIPLVVILIGSIAKKLARGSGWQRQDFFWGIELTLSSISGGLTLLFESNIDAPNNYRNTGIFLLLSLILFVLILSFHQDYQNTTPKKEYLWLIGFSNIIGIGLMTIFVFAIKR